MGDRELVQIVDDAMAEAARRSGSFLACRPGCTECCLGPFPITALDAARLRSGLETVSRNDPLRSESVRERARECVRLMAPWFPGDPESGVLDCDDATEERFCVRFEALPCPALNPATGCCDLYDSRPISCRTYGPPVRFGDEDMPPCRLCFTGATREQVENCRADVDPDDLEGELLRRADATGQTLVAFALLF